MLVVGRLYTILLDCLANLMPQGSIWVLIGATLQCSAQNIAWFVSATINAFATLNVKFTTGCCVPA